MYTRKNSLDMYIRNNGLDMYTWKNGLALNVHYEEWRAYLYRDCLALINTYEAYNSFLMAA